MLFHTICRIYIGRFNTSSWPHLFNFAVPFDARSVLGWYLLWFIQFNVDFLHVFCMVFISSYFICCCYYVEGICEHFNFVMQSIKRAVDENDVEKTAEKCQKIRQKITEAVKIHVEIFQ